MGCNMTKILSNESDDDGFDLPEPPPPAPQDPRVPLTPRQRYMITSSWRGIARAIEPTGINMFVKLFEDNMDILSLFDKFKELETRDEQAESLELAEHATIVMNSIDEGIRAMDNVDFFFDLLHQIGASHRRLPGFKKEYFWKIERPFLEAVQLTLDDRYSENIEKVYKITIRFIIETVIQGYDQAEGREVNDNVKEVKTPTGEGKSPSSPSSKSEGPHQTVNAFRMNIKSGGNVTSYSSCTKTSVTNGTASTEEEGATCPIAEEPSTTNNNKDS